MVLGKLSYAGQWHVDRISLPALPSLCLSLPPRSVMTSRVFRSSAVPTLIVQTLSLVITVLLICNVIARYTFGFPLLIEGVLQIFFSELNHRKQHRRYQRFEEQSNDVEELGEKALARTECVGAVIGYREDPNLFRKCLESYRDDASRTVRVLVIGIDGNDDEDMKMARTAEHVSLLLA